MSDEEKNVLTYLKNWIIRKLYTFKKKRRIPLIFLCERGNLWWENSKNVCFLNLLSAKIHCLQNKIVLISKTFEF